MSVSDDTRRDVKRTEATVTYLLAELARAEYALERIVATRHGRSGLADVWRVSVPASADLVATRLADLGIAGDHGCRTCPLALFLLRHGVAAAVKVHRVEIVAIDRRSKDALTVTGNMAWVPLPPVIAEFLDRFDDDKYPDLESPS